MREKTREQLKGATALLALVLAVGVAAVLLGSFVLGLGEEVQSDAPVDERWHPQDEVEVQTGWMEIMSEDADEEARELQELVTRIGGEPVTEERRETSDVVSYTVEVRVPDDEFEEAVETAKQEFDVVESEVGYDAVVVGETRNEIDILVYTLELYEDLLEGYEDADASELSASDVESISRFTDRPVELARELNDLEYDVSELERRGGQPTLEVEFQEEKETSIVSGGFREDARGSLASAVDSVSSAAAALVAAPFYAVALVLAVLRFAVYGVAVAAPFAVGYLLLKRLYV